MSKDRQQCVLGAVLGQLVQVERVVGQLSPAAVQAVARGAHQVGSQRFQRSRLLLAIRLQLPDPLAIRPRLRLSQHDSQTPPSASPYKPRLHRLPGRRRHRLRAGKLTPRPD